MIIYRQIHQMLSRLLRSENARELMIVLCIVIGYLAHYLMFDEGCQQYTLFNNECGYYSNYSAGFLKSFVYLIFCCCIATLTLSYRIIGLCVLVTASMFIDLAFVVSPEWYHVLSDIRYLKEINFKDIYTTYETSCILLSVCYWIVSYSGHGDDSDNDDSNDVDGCDNSRFNC